jgi:hypothetical protein
MIISFPCKDVLRRLLLWLDFSIFLSGIFSVQVLLTFVTQMRIFCAPLRLHIVVFFQPLFEVAVLNVLHFFRYNEE